MPPQNDQTPAPSSNSSDFDFMLKQQPAQPNQSPAGKFSRLNRPAKLLVAALIGLIIAIVAAVILGGGSNNSQQVLGLMAQGEEIIRVSQAQDQKLRDENTKGLSATTQVALKSQKASFGDYLSKAGVKYGPKELAAKQDKNTDTQLETAAQNNRLDNAYVEYLQTSLSAYLDSLRSASQTAKSKTLKEALQSADNSVDTLLKSPQFK